MPAARDSLHVNLFEPDLGGTERDAVLAVLDSGWLALGARCREFETAFAGFLGIKHAVAVNSCTAALHLAYRLASVQPGDEVIVPSLTFVATANAVTYCGGKPVFADITSESDWTLSPESVAGAVTPRTRAICVMHYGGRACDMAGIFEIADAAGVTVIEDACHGLGGRMADGRSIGTAGQMACFSFYSNKAITTGEGGMLVTDDGDLAERARLLRAHGMTSTTYERMRGAMGYDVIEIGYNYRLDEMRAALGLAQLRRLPDSLARRHVLAARYGANLTDIAGITMPEHGDRGVAAHYILPVIVDPDVDRDALRMALHEAGVQTSIHYAPVHRFTHYRCRSRPLPVTETVTSRALSLPLYPSLDEDMVDRICERIEQVLPGCRRALSSNARDTQP